MPPIIAEPPPFETPAEIRSKPSSTIWPSAPPRIATGCSASSTAMPSNRRSAHEASHPRSAWRKSQRLTSILEGVFLVRVDRAFYRWHPQRPFYVLRLAILEPREHQGRSLTGRLYCTPKALWKLRWFLRDFGYDPDLMGRDEVDEKALLGLRGIVRISHTTLNGRCFLNLGGFAPASEWEELSGPVASSQEVTHDV